MNTACSLCFIIRSRLSNLIFFLRTIVPGQCTQGLVEGLVEGHSFQLPGFGNGVRLGGEPWARPLEGLYRLSTTTVRNTGKTSHLCGAIAYLIAYQGNCNSVFGTGCSRTAFPEIN